MLNFRQRGHFSLDFRDGIGDREALAKNDFVNLPQSPYGGLGDSIALQPDFIDGAGLGRVSVHEHEWGHVLNHFGAAGDHGQFSYAAELMHGAHATDDRMILNRDMAGDPRHRDHDVVAHDDIVSDMAAAQDCVVRADPGHFAVAGRTVDGDSLPDGVEIPDLSSREAAFPFEVLRLQADRRERIDFVAATESGVAINYDMRMDAATVTQDDVLANHAIRPNLAISADFCFGMNDRRRMNHKSPDG